MPHQRIELIPPADKQASVDAERGENRHIIGLENDFLYKTKAYISAFLMQSAADIDLMQLKPVSTDCSA